MEIKNKYKTGLLNTYKPTELKLSVLRLIKIRKSEGEINIDNKMI